MSKAFSDPRKLEYLNAEGADRPLKSPIPLDTLKRARAYRKARIVEQLVKHECGAILLYDPINIRYTTDVSNMQIWTAHIPFHYVLMFADGYTIDFAFRGSEHTATSLETVDEVRLGNPYLYIFTGSRMQEVAGAWADEIVDEVKRHAGGNMRLAIDRLDHSGVDALRSRGLSIVEGQELAETARLIKSPEELELMRWTIRVCEAGMARMYQNSVAGKTEQEIWAELHYENIRSGGEWIETRLLTVGERTNPWFQECSDNVAQTGDLVAFDTDMVGPYGYCADLSRSWTVDHVPMTNEQRDIYMTSRDQIEHNIGIVRPGMTFREFNEKSWRIPERFGLHYGVALHGVGMVDESPALPVHPLWDKGIDDDVILPGMTLCAESLVGKVGGREAVKLEAQFLVTETGVERLDTFPWEDG
jgi:Xaa-Pro aminopeptidase